VKNGFEFTYLELNVLGLFGTKASPFCANTTREEREEWLASTTPWNEVSPKVIAAILDGITDKVLLEAFVLRSAKAGLVARYAALDIPK
jgi:hypothetical protein